MIITKNDGHPEGWSVDYVAKHTGMSTEGVRYYDKTNILTIERNNENGRRIYKSEDIFTLMMLQRYRGLEFSISDAERIIFDPIEKSVKKLCFQEKELDRRLEHLRLTINEIQKTIRLMSLIGGLKEEERSFSVSMLKPFYYFRIVDESDSREKAARRKQLVKRWYDLKPAVRATIMFDVEDGGQQIKGDTFLVMNLEDSRYLRAVDEESADIVQMRGGKKCITMAGKCTTNPVEYVLDAYHKAVEYADRMNAVIDPTILDDPLYFHKEGNKSIYYKKLLFSIS